MPSRRHGGDQEVDLEKIVHLRAKNALWRSWSIDGLSEAGGVEPESVGTAWTRRPSVKSSPKAWEVFYERYLLDGGDTSLAVELSRRHHYPPHSAGGDSNAARRHTDAAPAAAASSERWGVEGAVRGGQLFSHLAGRGGRYSAKSGGHDSGGDSDCDVGMSRAGSGGGELVFEPEMSRSYDQHLNQSLRLRSSSVGSFENSTTPHRTLRSDRMNTRLSDPILRDGPEGNELAGRMNLLRKTFTQARNKKLLDMPDDSVSPFLGDELSVHHSNYFGSSWGARSFGQGGSGGGGGGDRFARPWTGGAFDIVGSGATGGIRSRHFGGSLRQQQLKPLAGVGVQPDFQEDGGGSGGVPFGRSKYTSPLGDLEGAAAVGAPAAGVQESATQHRGRDESAGASASLFVSSAQRSTDDAASAVVSTTRRSAGAAAAAHHGTAADSIKAARDNERDEHATEGSFIAAPPVYSGDDVSHRERDGSTNSITQQRRHEEQQIHSLGKREAPRQPPGDTAGKGLIGNLRPIPAGGSIGIGGGIGAKSTSALDKLVDEEDDRQAVMMPLMDWNDWTSDRLHWTFPAVVHAFPRSLYEIPNTNVRNVQGGSGADSTQRRSRDRSAAGAVLAIPPVAATVGGDSSMLVEGHSEVGGRGSAGGGLPQGNDIGDVLEEETLRHRRGELGVGGEDGREVEQAEQETASPFEPYSLGEVYIRTAPASDLAPAGVGAGSWKRRWLVLRQTYVFELLEPPSPPVSALSMSPNSQMGTFPPLPLALSSLSDAAAADATLHAGQDKAGMSQVAGARGPGGALEQVVDTRGNARQVGKQAERGGVGDDQGQQQKKQQQQPVRARRDGEKYVAPVGFLCLSNASVEDGGINWGPKTLLLRCQARPADVSREVASAAGGVGISAVGIAGASDNASVRARRRDTEIRVELRVPSPEVGERWAALFRERAALEMSSLFEPSPGGFEDYTRGDHVRGDSGGSDTASASGGEGEFETDTGFPVLGTGRFSKVVLARRKQTWAGAGGRACAIKIVDKQAFWSRVRIGKERVDTLAREVFCQMTLTIKGADSDLESTGNGDSDSCANPSGNNNNPEDRPSRRPSGAEAAANDDTGGGRIVRIHSVLETADDLILEMDLMSRCDLFDRLLELNGAFTERQAAGMARNLLFAIDKCNRLGFCHRDVKPSNLLYPGPATSHGSECVLLADFGMATTAGRDGLVRGRCGTPGFVAPEILKSGKLEGYGINVDIFSAGVVLYICLCGYEPFFGVTEKDIIAANKEAVFEFPAAEWDGVSDGAKDLICKMMEPDPLKRITPSDALRHPWIVEHQTPPL